jgi:hypothetical protein
MKTLLRRVESGLYFQGPDRWTGDPRKALNFKSIDRALQFVEQWALKNVELAFAFEEDAVTGVPLEKIGLRYSED